MEKLETRHEPSGSYYRIIAFWIVLETVLGGILHALHIPVTGFVVGGLALFCQIALAWSFPQKGSLMKATLLVLVWKAMLSPQSPPTAYLAVTFQGLMAEFFLRPFGKPTFLIRALIFGVVTQLESAIQRLLILVFVAGDEFRIAFDAWVGKVTGLKLVDQVSVWLAFAYLFLHVFVGVWFSYLAWRWVTGRVPLPPEHRIKWDSGKGMHSDEKKKSSSQIAWLLMGSILLFWLILSWFAPKWAPLPSHKVGKILFRFGLILGVWIWLIQPLLRSLIQQFLNRYKSKLAEELAHLEQLLPVMRNGISQAWGFAKRMSFPAGAFLRILMLNLLAPEEKS